MSAQLERDDTIAHHNYPDARITVYADGDGTWHVYVPETFASPLVAARGAIHAEMWNRSDMRPGTLEALSAYVRKNVHEDLSERAGYRHFTEKES
jgi:hypothetical protein